MIIKGWFVPLDFMVHWQALPNLSRRSLSLHASYPQYEKHCLRPA